MLRSARNPSSADTGDRRSTHPAMRRSLPSASSVTEGPSPRLRPPILVAMRFWSSGVLTSVRGRIFLSKNSASFSRPHASAGRFPERAVGASLSLVTRRVVPHCWPLSRAAGAALEARELRDAEPK